MSDTPRTDAALDGWTDDIIRQSRLIPADAYAKVRDLSRQLERELIVAQGLEQMAMDQRDKAWATPPEALIPKWIPVGERLPEARYGVGVGHPAIISDNVLVGVEGDVSVANYDQEEKIWTSQEGGVWCGLEPTHWMPLPEAPVSPQVMPTEKK